MGKVKLLEACTKKTRKNKTITYQNLSLNCCLWQDRQCVRHPCAHWETAICHCRLSSHRPAELARSLCDVWAYAAATISRNVHTQRHTHTQSFHHSHSDVEKKKNIISAGWNVSTNRCCLLLLGKRSSSVQHNRQSMHFLLAHIRARTHLHKHTHACTAHAPAHIQAECLGNVLTAVSHS